MGFSHPFVQGLSLISAASAPPKEMLTDTTAETQGAGRTDSCRASIELSISLHPREHCVT